MSSVDFASNIVEKKDSVKLKNLGVHSRDIKFGINIDPKYDNVFNNTKNPFLVYRAYTIDNSHAIKKELKLSECKMDENPESDHYNKRWFRKTFCMNLDFEYLRGDYTTPID